MTRLRPFGLWESALTTSDLALGTTLRDLAWDSDGKTLVWLETRGDRGVLVCQRPGQAPRDLTTALSVRARVGYGGGDFTVAGGSAYFVEDGGRVHRQQLDSGSALPITPSFGNAAAPRVSGDGRWLVYVHSDAGVDCLAIVDTQGHYWPQRLASGADFYMQPAWHPDGRSLAWVEWDHPNMPRDGSRLMLGSLQRREKCLPVITTRRQLVGADDVAVFQPEFSPDGRYLVYASDRRGWSNLWRHDLERDEQVCLTEDESDVGLPAWAQGMRVFGFSADGQRLFFTRSEPAARRLWCLEMDNGGIEAVDEVAEYSSIEQVATASRGPGVAAIGSSACIGARLISRDGRGQCLVHARSSSESVPPTALAGAEPVCFAAASGDTLRGLYYPPTNPECEGSGLPPAILLVHGGPTGQADVGYNAKAQFFATRGYAVLDLDYRGSTGYGRAYQQALAGNWGVADADDAIGAGRYLSESCRADGERLVLMGSSAGGYTVLRTLTTHPGFFKAGVCVYGISDLLSIATDTHKFEAHYLDSLVGPLPEASAIYRERSPLFAADSLSDPVAIFHGSEDKVVPLDQAERIVASLRKRGVQHEYHVYQGEGHGWRKPETIRAFYEALELFLRRAVLLA